MRDQVMLIARAVPRLLGRVLLGGFVGGMLGGFVGTVASAVAYFLGGSGQGWTALAIAGLSTLAFTVGGAYIGALRGCARALAGVVQELGLIPRLWEQVKPQVVRYVGALRGGARHAEARAMALTGWQPESDAATPDAGIAEKAEIFIAGMLQATLAGGMLRGMLSESDGGAQDWGDVENAGLKRAHEAVADLIGRLFHGPALLAMLISVAVALAPHAIYAAASL